MARNRPAAIIAKKRHGPPHRTSRPGWEAYAVQEPRPVCQHAKGAARIAGAHILAADVDGPVIAAG
jgi:hypothetical protein